MILSLSTMKKLFPFFLAVLLMLPAAVSCKKDNPAKIKYGVDGKTPLPEAVDLGIVVNGKSVKWASFNLGASKETDYGYYLAWGETEEKENYTWATYKYAKGSGNKLTRYCPKDKQDYWGGESLPDNETTLLPSDDAAHQKLGGKWRMPTKEELEALFATRDNPEDYEWAIEMPMDADGNEIRDPHETVVRGWRISSLKKGTSIFIPFSGLHNSYGTSQESSYTGNGKLTAFLSSTVDPETPSSVAGLAFALESKNVFMGKQGRSTGLPLRPVYVE